jgi:glycosyltransferase involved in cell wall biosynthesis
LTPVPLVSAAIVTYNRAAYLGDAIESVLAQTFADLEVIVVDDGSTDDTERVVEPYLDRVRYIRQENGGESAARNTAIAAAQGEFLAFCDSDDRWYPDRLERQTAAVRDRPRVGLVHGHVELIDEDGNRLPEQNAAHRAIFSAAHRKPVTYAGYAWNCRCLSSATLFRRSVFDEIGGYDLALPAAADYDVYLRLVLAGYEVVFLHGAPLAEYRLHAEQSTAYNLGMGQILTAEKHLALLDERNDVPHARLARRNFNLMIARSWRVLGERRKARRAALRAFRLGAPQALRFAR